jgi:NAD(P)-dependent dehydrogenase (short-subunit alcohol dehydrogenase family)
MLLKDKVCIVVGAASPRSIGYAVAELFAEHGAKVVAVDLAMDDRVASDIKASIDKRTQRDCDVIGLRCDIASASDCDKVVSETLARFG